MTKDSNKFTDREIKSFPSKYAGRNKPIDVREKSGQGFVVTVFPSGELSFIYIYHYESRKRRMTLGKYPHMSLADAHKLHREALKILENGKDPALEKRKERIAACDSSTVSALIDEYIEVWAKPRKRSWKADERCLNVDVRPRWGKLKAKDITKRDVVLLLEDIVKRGAPIAANRAFACMRRMFNFGVERDLITTSPCSAVKAPAKENRRERFLSVDEIKIFWDKLDIAPMSSLTKLALKFQLVTAQRKGEVISAEWSEISGDVWTIPSEKAKNGRIHRVVLSELALEILDELKMLSGSSRWLFPAQRSPAHMTGAAVDHALRRSRDVFPNINDFSPHTLRATATSHMASMKISGEVLSRILNHAKKGVTERHYNKYDYDDEKRNALESWSRKLKEIINSEQTTNVIALKEVI